MTYHPMTKRLMSIDSAVWRRLGISAGWSANPREKTIENSRVQYYSTLRLYLSHHHIRQGSIPRRVFRELENENYHSLNSFLRSSGYYQAGDAWPRMW